MRRKSKFALTTGPLSALTVSLCSQSSAPALNRMQRTGTCNDLPSLIQCALVSWSAFVLSASNEFPNFPHGDVADKSTNQQPPKESHRAALKPF